MHIARKRQPPKPIRKYIKPRRWEFILDQSLILKVDAGGIASGKVGPYGVVGK
jgi:hypothetical protein